MSSSVISRRTGRTGHFGRADDDLPPPRGPPMKFPRKTIFVLGAGASVPYELPTGPGLKAQVIKNGLQSPSLPEVAAAIEASGATHEGIREVLKDMGRSDSVSIDDWARDNVGVDVITKSLIASSLLHMENDKSVCPVQGLPNTCRDWLGPLLNHLISAGLLNEVAFVTFNFDRVLERRVLSAMQGRYRIAHAATAWERLGNLTVVHVSGILGEPEWAGGDSTLTVPFSSGITVDHVRRAAGMIHYVHEARSAADLATAESLISQSPLVVFLGFGFHRTNVDHLKIKRRPDARFIASAFNLTAAEAREIELDFPTRIRLYERCDALDLLRRAPNLHGELDAQPAGDWVDDYTRRHGFT